MNRQFRNRALSGMMAALMVFSTVGTSVMDVYASAQDVPAATAAAESTVSTAEDGIQVQLDENSVVVEETANVQNETEVQAEAESEEGSAEAVPEAADEAYSAASYAEETDTGDSAPEVTDNKAKAADKAKEAPKKTESDVVDEVVDEVNPNALSEAHKEFIRLLAGSLGFDAEYYIAGMEQNGDFPLVGGITSDGWKNVADSSSSVVIYLTEDENDIRHYGEGDFGTYYRSVQLGDYQGNGNAICVMPSLDSNGPGYYNAYPITNAAMRKLMYYAPGAYGYENSYNAQLAYVVVGAGNQYTFWHLVASYALELIANGGEASQATDWAKDISDNQYNAVLTLYSQILALPDAPDDFGCYIFPTSSNAQAIAFFTGYTPPSGGSLSLKKAPVSGSEECVKDNPCYSLEGATYELHNAATDALVGTFTVNADGTTNKITDIPAGDYYVIETAAGKGYKLDTEKHNVSIAANEDKTFNVYDEPYMDPIMLEIFKEDAETGGKASGGASLAGAQFEIRYYNDYYTKDTLPGSATRTWTVQTYERNGKYRAHLAVDESVIKELSDEFYKFGPNAEIPLGTIAVVETKAPTGYQLPADPVLTVQQITPEYITKVIVDGQASTSIEEKPIRGDMTLTKVDEYGEKLANIPWLITSNTTGESHIVVTDANGKVDTAALLSANASKANANDAAYVNGQIDESKLDATAPVWFGEGTPATKGAFLFDTYTITELSCSANAGMSMITKTFTIKENGKTVDLGEIVNVGGEVKIRTTATDSVTKTHFGTKSETAIIEDVVKCEGLTVGKEYKLSGTLYDKLTGETIKDASGKAVTATKTFTATAENQNVTVSFTFDSSIIKTTAVVVGEDLYKGDRLISTHFDLKDEAQAVYYPEIGTTLKDATTEEHISLASEHTVNVDTISYESLVKGKTYTSVGFLADPETGRALKKDGTVSEFDVKALYEETQGKTGTEAIADLIAKAEANSLIFATDDFTADAANGTATVTFEYDSTPFSGKKVVAAEAVYEEKAGPVAVHFDPTDEEQTVWIPEILTKAAGKETGTKDIPAAADSVITDTVTWSGVKAETTFKAVAEAYLKGDTASGDKKLAEASKEVTVSAEKGSFKVDITVDTTGLEGREIYIVERCYLVNGAGENLIGEHADREDQKQTVKVPGLGTTLTDAGTGEHVSIASKKTVQNDVIAYKGMIAGKTYTSVGFLADPETGYALKTDGTTFSGLDIISLYKNTSGASREEAIASLIKTAQDNGLIFATADFTAEAAEGTATVVFEYDSTPFAGKSVVAAEGIYDEKGNPTAVHFDPTDEDQTVWIPDIGTTLKDATTEEHISLASEHTVNVDTISYKGMVAGKTYTSAGFLADPETGRALKKDGTVSAFDVSALYEETKGKAGAEAIAELVAKAEAEGLIFATADFTADAAEGTTSVTFEYDSTPFTGKKVVAAEAVYDEKAGIVAVHFDPTDEEQTVWIPKLITKAVGKDTGAKAIAANADSVITDTVTWSGIKADTTLKAVAEAWLKGETAAQDMKLAEVSKEVTVNAETGSFKVDVPVDATGLEGKEIYIVERCYLVNDAGENIVGEHADRDDEKQTVIVPGLGTTLEDAETKEHISLASKKTVQIDTIAYKGLITGKTYTSVGFLADPETGYALKTDGTTYTGLDILSIYRNAKGSSKEEVIASLIKTAEDNGLIFATADFTAEAAEGTATVTFEYDSTPFAGKSVVAAEGIYDENGKPMAVHFDPKDEDQTVWIPKIVTKAAGDNGEKVIPEDVTDVAIKDTLTWEGVKAETTFKVVTKAFAKGETKEDDVLLADTSAEPKVITASGETGTASIIVKVDTTGHGGKSIYISEYCYLETPDGDKLIGKHEGRNDNAQTVTVPHIGTTLEDAVTMSHISFVEKEVTQVDTIDYEGLVKGKKYTAIGIMTDRETGYALVKGGGTYTDKAVADLYDPKAPAASTIVLLDSINVIYATADFTAEDTKGQATVTFKYDAVPFAGGAAVAAEAIYPFGKEPVAVHFDPTDEDQTVWFPEIVTKAADKADGTKLIAADKGAVIVDTLTWTGVKADTEFTITAKAFVKGATAAEDKQIGETVTKTVTAKTETGSVDVDIPVDTSDLAGQQIYITELCTIVNKDGETVPVGEHADRTDEDQTVTVPKIGTTLVDEKTELHVSYPGEQTVQNDTIKYTGLIAGDTYTAFGILADPETGKAFKKDGTVYEGAEVLDLMKAENGKDKTAEEKAEAIKARLEAEGILYATAEFTAEGTDGEAVVTFKYDGTPFRGKKVVAAEAVYEEGEPLAVHFVPTDEDQTVSFPDLITTAENAANGAKTVFAGKDQTIKDTVKWTGITAPTTYSLTTGVFVKGATAAEDKMIAEATETFEVTEAEGTYAVEIPVDLTGLDGSVVYITEKIDLVKKGESGEDELVPVVDHVDRDDEDQSVSVPEIGTTLLDKKTESHNTFAEKEVVNVDTILYKGLEAGKTYTAVGILANPETGNALTADGKDYTAKTVEELGKAEGKTAEERTAAIIAALKEANIIYATAEFTPEAADGSTTVEFTYDATVFAGRKVVAAETVYEEGEIVAVHFDMEDEAQMVNIPKIGTTAVDGADGDKKVLESTKATIKDTIAYESITPGTELTAVAVVYDKSTGKPILVNGKEVTATADFTAEKEKGTTVVSITFDATGLANKSLVVSEKVYLKGTDKLVAEHTDMKDAAQTVTVYKNPTPPTTTTKKSSTTTAKSVKTGDNMGVIFAGIILIAALGAGFVVISRRKKRA